MRNHAIVLLVGILTSFSTLCQNEKDSIWIEVRGSDTTYCMTPLRAQKLSIKIIDSEQCQDSLNAMVKKDSLSKEQLLRLQMMYDHKTTQYVSCNERILNNEQIISNQNTIIAIKDENINLYKKRRLIWAVGGFTVGVAATAIITAIILK